MPPNSGLFGQAFLNEFPEAAFFANLPGNLSPNQRSFFDSQFQPVRNQFFGQLGQQAQTGSLPTLQFTDFLSGFDFEDLFRQQPRFQRGFSSGLFNPRTRFLFQGV